MTMALQRRPAQERGGPGHDPSFYPGGEPGSLAPMGLSFANTEIAFRSKSDADLRRADWIFRSFGHPRLVKAGTTALRAALALHLPVKGLVKHTIFRQFVGG